jgi:diguanylate cyclase (GGDEF)-like protein/PAS domain S-box-containing protein
MVSDYSKSKGKSSPTVEETTQLLLEQTRKNYEAFFNSIDEFLFVLDEQGNIVHVNKTVVDRLGYSEQELVGKSVLMAHPPERREEAGRIVGEMLAGRAEFCPVPLMTKSGEYIPVETRVTAGTWNGAPAIFGVTKDMSRLKLSEEKFSKAFHSNSVLMALSSFEDGRYMDVNKTFLQTLGFTSDEVIGKTSTELGLFANPGERSRLIEIIKRGGVMHGDELEVKTKDGSLRHGLFSAAPIYIGKEPCLLTVMVDITERRKAEHSLQQQNQYFSVLYEILLDLLNHRKVDELLQAIVNHVTVLFNAPFVELMLEENGVLIVKTFTQSQSFLKGDRASRDSARLSWQAFDTKLPVVLEDYSAYPYRRDIYSGVEIHAVANFPILIGDKCIGVLALGRSKPDQVFDEIQVKNGILLAQLVALVLDKAHLLSNMENEIAERKQAKHELELQHDFLTQILDAMGQGLTVTNEHGVFEFVNPAYARLFGYEAVDLIGKSPAQLTVPEDIKILEKQKALRKAGKTSTYESRLRRLDGSVAHVLITGVPRQIDGRYVGAIAAITDLTEQKKVEEELRRAKQDLELANRKLEQALAREQQLARTDALTGLSNRGFLIELAERKLNTALRYQLPFSVILLDVDHFKMVNDVYGHAVGDLALQSTTQVICETIRSADVIGRYGGDEFVVLLPHSTALAAARLAERIHDNIANVKIETPKGKLSLAISLGIAELHHKPPDTLESLFLRADQALYSAKQAGRSRTCVSLKDNLHGGSETYTVL